MVEWRPRGNTWMNPPISTLAHWPPTLMERQHPRRQRVELPRCAHHMATGNTIEDRPSCYTNCTEARKWRKGDGIQWSISLLWLSAPHLWWRKDIKILPLQGSTASRPWVGKKNIYAWQPADATDSTAPVVGPKIRNSVLEVYLPLCFYM